MLAKSSTHKRIRWAPQSLLQLTNTGPAVSGMPFSMRPAPPPRKAGDISLGEALSPVQTCSFGPPRRANSSMWRRRVSRSFHSSVLRDRIDTRTHTHTTHTRKANKYKKETIHGYTNVWHDMLIPVQPSWSREVASFWQVSPWPASIFWLSRVGLSSPCACDMLVTVYVSERYQSPEWLVRWQNLTWATLRLSSEVLRIPKVLWAK